MFPRSKLLIAALVLIAVKAHAFPHHGIAKISAGLYNGCALLADRQIACWGMPPVSNDYAPSVVQGIGPATDVAIGDGFACALLTNHSIWCWGWNSGGALGRGGSYGVFRDPQPVLTYSDFSAVAAGDLHACGLRLDSTVACWGSNAVGAVGDWHGTHDSVFSPALVYVDDTSHGDPLLSGVRQIATGLDHSCAVLSDGSISCWGGNQNGELGNLDVTAKAVFSPTKVRVLDYSTGKLVNFQIGSGSLSSGYTHSCVLQTIVTCWGDNQLGALGNPSNNSGFGDEGKHFFSSLPGPVVNSDGTSFAHVIAMTSGDEFSCALLEDSSMNCWGSNEFGQLANDSFADALSMLPISAMFLGTPVRGIEQVAAGGGHVCALTQPTGGKQRVFCWGGNYYGELGSGFRDGDVHNTPEIPAVDATLFSDNFDGN